MEIPIEAESINWFGHDYVAQLSCRQHASLVQQLEKFRCGLHSLTTMSLFKALLWVVAKL
jgi:hypothetical protein